MIIASQTKALLEWGGPQDSSIKLQFHIVSISHIRQTSLQIC